MSAYKTCLFLIRLLCVSGGLAGLCPLYLRSEPLGPASRNTGLVISEIMYSQPPSSFGTNLDFIEIYNSNPWPEDIGGYSLSGSVNASFPPDTVIPAHGFLLLAPDCDAIDRGYRLSNNVSCFRIYSAENEPPPLPDQEGLIQLRSPTRLLLEVAYDNDPPWPKLADELGHSLVLARPSLGQGNPLAWSASALPGGSPGKLEPSTNNPLSAVVINEVLAHSVEPDLDFIELYNRSDQDLDISGCSLSDTARTPKYFFQATIIPAHSYLALDEFILGFSLRPEGEAVYFRGPDQTLLEAFEVEARPAGVSMGRIPEGGDQRRALFPATPFAPNINFYSDDIVINEIMFAPLSGNSDDEYIEIYNKSTNAIDLSGWEFTRGVTFAFPVGSTIAPGGFKVVAHNAARLLTNYPYLSPAVVAGSFERTLADEGERIVLSKPVIAGVGAETNVILVIADDLTYGRWGRWSAGGGSSLELINPRADNSEPSNWADSDETRKGAWASIEFTDWLEHGRDTANELHLLMLGVGECLVDDLEVRSGAGNNLVLNPGFESGTNGWVIQGNHVRSSIESEGYLSSSSLRLRASGPGDTGVNRIETDLLSTVSTNAPVTFRANVRWLAGHPGLLLRLAGNWAEASVRLPVPTNLGTPGLPNSRWLANAGPAITHVQHSPVLPAGGQPILVTAEAADPDGLGGLTLFYRLAGTNSVSSVPMLDDGTAGDRAAADGIFSATLPGNAAGTMMSFYIQSVDAAPAPAASRYPAKEPLTCLVRFGETANSDAFPDTRIWMENAALGEWTTRSRFSDEPLNCTVVYNHDRVIHNAGIHYWGDLSDRATFSTPVTDGARYLVRLPPNEPLLGSSSLYLDGVTPRDDPTLLREMLAFKLAQALNLPDNHLSFAHVILNGVHHTNRNIPLFMVRQVPDADYLASWVSDSDEGDFYRAQPWAEFNDGPYPDGIVKSYATLASFASANGGKKLARYRANWAKLPNLVLNDAYGSLFSLVDILNAPDSTFIDHVRATLDLNEWLGIMALRHLIGDGKGYGYNLGRDAFIFRHPESGWKLLANQLGHSFGLGDPASASPLAVADPALARVLNEPEFLRRYYSIVQQALDGPFRFGYLNTNFLQPRIDALSANGIAIAPEQVTSIQNWIIARRAVLQAALPPAVLNPNLTFSFPDDNNLLRISGTASINGGDISINGLPFPVSWTSLTNWHVTFPVEDSKPISIYGGGTLLGATNFLTQWPFPPLEESLVFNEIMYNPAVPGASYFEIYNRTALALNLSRWDIPELDYEIPDGTILHPFEHLVFVENRDVFIQTYGIGIPIAGEFGVPITGSSTGAITLLKDEIGGSNDNQFVDQVKFETGLPWPALANRSGYSMQLIDPAADGTQPCNWSDGTGWRYFAVSGIPGATSGRVSLFLDQPGIVAIDAITLVEGIPPETGTNVLQGGGFETGVLGAWQTSGTHTGSRVVTGVAFRGTNSLRLIATGAGGQVFQDVTNLHPNKTYTLSFWYRSQDSGSLYFRMNSSFRGDVLFGPNLPTPTPGVRNSAPYGYKPRVTPWISELHLSPATNALDNFGEAEAWLEIHNGSEDVTIPLEGFYLTDNFTNLTRWAFPTGSTIGPQEFKVIWLDGEPAETAGGHWHTSFRLSPQGGSIALVQLTEVGPLVLDYITYTAFAPNLSWVSFPEDQRLDRYYTSTATPGASNRFDVFINEWMPVNRERVPDPADGAYQDWFELYNAGDFPIDLSGFYLSDTDERGEERIPDGTIIPGKGFLIVWADGQKSQNNIPKGQIHVNFGLGRSDDIGLFFPNRRTLVDYIQYENAGNDESYGRFPDGSPNLTRMNEATPKAANDGNSNAPPVFEEGYQLTSLEGERIETTIYVYDPDVPTQHLTYSLISAPAKVFLTSQGYLSWSPPPIGPTVTSNRVVFSVRDSGFPSLSTTGVLWLILGNSPPVFAPVSNATILAGTTLTRQLVATDTPGQRITYSFLQWVDGASIDPATGVFTWTPPNSMAPGSYYFSIRAEDDQAPPGTATASFFVDVFTPVITNAPPVFAPVSNATVKAGTAFTMRLTATDTAGQRITYSLSSSVRPPGSTIGASDGVFSWTPSVFQSAGRFYATVFATDDQNPPATAQVTFYIDVLPANTPPVFQIVSNSVVSAGSTLTVNIIARDTPGQQVTYALLARPSGATINSTNGLFTWNVPASQDLGRYYVTVQAADDQTPAATASFTFAIDVVGQPKLRIARVSNPGFLIFWPTVPGTTYELQYKTNFTGTNWTSIVGPFVAQQTIYSYSGPFNGTSRFYRLKATY